MRMPDLRKENPRLFDPKSDLITPEEYAKMSLGLRAELEALLPGERHLFVPPLPADVETVTKAFIEKLEKIPGVESLVVYDDPHNLCLWALTSKSSYKLDKRLAQVVSEMMDKFPRYLIDYFWVHKRGVENAMPNGFAKKWERKKDAKSNRTSRTSQKKS